MQLLEDTSAQYCINKHTYTTPLGRHPTINTSKQDSVDFIFFMAHKQREAEGFVNVCCYECDKVTVYSN